jgi:hypothetical protein
MRWRGQSRLISHVRKWRILTGLWYRLWMTKVAIRGFEKGDMKLENARRLTATCALPGTALVEKSTAARERYIQPRLGQQGSSLAVKQVCMRSLGRLARYTS